MCQQASVAKPRSLLGGPVVHAALPAQGGRLCHLARSYRDAHRGHRDRLVHLDRADRNCPEARDPLEGPNLLPDHVGPRHLMDPADGGSGGPNTRRLLSTAIQRHVHSLDVSPRLARSQLGSLLSNRLRGKQAKKTPGIASIRQEQHRERVTIF